MPEIADGWMKKAGLWQGPTSRGVHPGARICAFILLISCISQTVTLLTSFHDPQSLLDSFSVLSFCSMGLVKLTSMRVCIGSWRSLVDLAENIEKQHFQSEDPTESEGDSERETESSELRKRITYTEKITQLGHGLPIMYWSTLAVFAAAPFVEFALLYPKDSNLKYPHILPVWAPFDDNIFIYSVTVVLEVISAFYCVCLHVAFDVSSVGFMILISGQFSILRRNLRRVGGRGRLLFKSELRDRRAHLRIVECHQHHIVLMEMNRILDSLMKPTMGIYVNMVTLTLCATAVQLTNPMSGVQLMTLVVYICASVTQLFIFCWFGDAVFSESNMRCGTGAWGAAWWRAGTRARRELLLLGLGTARPLQIRAGWFHTLNLPSFLSVLQTAYSFYAVLSKKQ